VSGSLCAFSRLIISANSLQSYSRHVECSERGTINTPLSLLEPRNIDFEIREDHANHPLPAESHVFRARPIPEHSTDQYTSRLPFRSSVMQLWHLLESETLVHLDAQILGQQLPPAGHFSSVGRTAEGGLS
jgi:hypothetical protein